LPEGAVGVINIDDRRGPEMAAAAKRPVTYAIDGAADVRPGPLTFSLDGLTFDIRTPRGAIHVRSRLVGRPNAYNILAASAAAMLSDLVIVTSDNPRSEDPERIIEEIRRGIVIPANRVAPKGQHGTPSLAIVDRREAIEKGIREAKPGDLVLIAGKGHEKYQ